MNILLVNQEYLQAEDLQKIQQSLNTSLFFAVTWNDALRLLLQNRMDFVILDDRQEDNEQFLQLIRQNPSRTRIILTNAGKHSRTPSKHVYRFDGYPEVDNLIRILETFTLNNHIKE